MRVGDCHATFGIHYTHKSQHQKSANFSSVSFLAAHHHPPQIECRRNASEKSKGWNNLWFVIIGGVWVCFSVFRPLLCAAQNQQAKTLTIIILTFHFLHLLIQTTTHPHNAWDLLKAMNNNKNNFCTGEQIFGKPNERWISIRESGGKSDSKRGCWFDALPASHFYQHANRLSPIIIVIPFSRHIDR